MITTLIKHTHSFVWGLEMWYKYLKKMEVSVIFIYKLIISWSVFHSLLLSGICLYLYSYRHNLYWSDLVIDQTTVCKYLVSTTRKLYFCPVLFLIMIPLTKVPSTYSGVETASHVAHCLINVVNWNWTAYKVYENRTRVVKIGQNVR